MNFKKVTSDTMVLKEGNGRQTGVSAHIKEVAYTIPEGEAVSMAEFAKDLVDSGKVKDTHQAYIRLNNFMRSKEGMEDFERCIDKKDSYTYIGRKVKEKIPDEDLDLSSEATRLDETQVSQQPQ